MSYDNKTDWYYEGNISRALVQDFSEKGFTIIKHNQIAN